MTPTLETLRAEQLAAGGPRYEVLPVSRGTFTHGAKTWRWLPAIPARYRIARAICLVNGIGLPIFGLFAPAETGLSTGMLAFAIAIPTIGWLVLGHMTDQLLIARGQPTAQDFAEAEALLRERLASAGATSA